MKRSAGFTLIELLVAASLMTLVMGSLLATFYGGTRLWERYRHTGYQDQGVRIALEEMAQRLHRIRPFSPIAFSGRYDELSFPVRMRTRSEDGASGPEIGEVRYTVRKKRLCRTETPYRLLKSSSREAACKVLCEGVEKLRLRYYHYNAARDTYVWSSTWQGEELPLAVAMELTYHDKTGKDSRTQSRTVHLPTSVVR